MEFFHLSHTDLDGFGCQLISKKIFPDGHYFNANYGLEVKTNLSAIINEIKKYKDKNVFFLISDLNLNKDESKILDQEIDYLNKNDFNIKLQLLDHHGSGHKSADNYDWYYLDTSRSATKIVYEYFKNNYNNFDSLCDQKFEILIEAINAVDIWIENSAYFEFGKVCLSMIAKAYEINNILFVNENRHYRLHLLNSSLKYINGKNAHIHLDESIYNLKKQYLRGNQSNNTIDNLSSQYLVKLLDDKKSELTIYYKNYKGLLTFTLGGISIPANNFLKENPDYDFFMDVSRKGKASMRANGKLDVANFAEKLANGGGHPNASGMAFDDWKDKVMYSDVKQYIEEKINNIS
ncbi:3'-to-5' oligoribonuclease B, Bacillus type [hydrothermal vent metagenome]|uniref:3'-to-5' oligoribonuclease B, Bacillus type n=1 Tax=hydrothermal vent metagenome TaxID=652676 RepID=A0A3B1E546_9ZZZZ